MRNIDQNPTHISPDRLPAHTSFSSKFGKYRALGLHSSHFKNTLFLSIHSLLAFGILVFALKSIESPVHPQGYADDLATCCLSKRKTDAVMDIVCRHGCTWRYDFNARKSGILVYGENRRDHVRNSENRSFKLGLDRVKEVAEYDHVGAKTSIFPDSTSGVEERINKARRV